MFQALDNAVRKRRAHLHTQGSLKESTCAGTKKMESRISRLEDLSCLFQFIREDEIETSSGGLDVGDCFIGGGEHCHGRRI